MHDGADSKGQVTSPEPQDKHMKSGALLRGPYGPPSGQVNGSAIAQLPHRSETLSWYTTGLKAAFTTHYTDN